MTTFVLSVFGFGSTAAHQKRKNLNPLLNSTEQKTCEVTKRSLHPEHDVDMPLHVACYQGKISSAIDLIHRDPYLCLSRRDGRNPIQEAYARGHYRLIKLILQDLIFQSLPELWDGSGGAWDDSGKQFSHLLDWAYGVDRFKDKIFGAVFEKYPSLVFKQSGDGDIVLNKMFRKKDYKCFEMIRRIYPRCCQSAEEQQQLPSLSEDQNYVTPDFLQVEFEEIV